MTTAQMQQQSNFTSATAANGYVNPHWDFVNTWAMVNGRTYPLLDTFVAPTAAVVSAGTTRRTFPAPHVVPDF